MKLAGSIKIVCNVSGGVLQSVYTNFLHPVLLDVVLVDEDNLKAEGKTQKQIDSKHKHLTKNMTAIF